MTKFHARFPDGAAGAALLVIRIAQAATSLTVLLGAPKQELLLTIIAVIASMLLLAGLFVRPTALVLAALCVLAAASWHGAAQCVLLGHACSDLALALLGAGAYSLDARLFGRRVIDLKGSRTRGGPGSGSANS
jgi:uncharacterized membrane protein YphA (DoxX/SURF4 family)